MLNNNVEIDYRRIFVKTTGLRISKNFCCFYRFFAVID